jgi:hypothetical protein
MHLDKGYELLLIILQLQTHQPSEMLRVVTDRLNTHRICTSVKKFSTEVQYNYSNNTKNSTSQNMCAIGKQVLIIVFDNPCYVTVVTLFLIIVFNINFKIITNNK